MDVHAGSPKVNSDTLPTFSVLMRVTSVPSTNLDQRASALSSATRASFGSTVAPSLEATRADIAVE